MSSVADLPPLPDPTPLRQPDIEMSSRAAWAWCYGQWRGELLSGDAVEPERRMLLIAGCSFATQMLSLFDREGGS